MVFAPARFLGIAAKIRPRDMMMMAKLSAPYAAETALSLVYAGICLCINFARLRLHLRRD